jgi:hypothetical protein
MIRLTINCIKGQSLSHTHGTWCPCMPILLLLPLPLPGLGWAVCSCASCCFQEAAALSIMRRQTNTYG